MGWLSRMVRGNTRVVPTIVTVPDAWGVQAASLSMATATFSPASVGVHTPGRPGAAGFTGDPGYGVNRWSGAGPDNVTIQNLASPLRPVEVPKSQRLGAGAGASGQPGLPSTGDQTGAMDWGMPSGLGMGG